MKNYFDVAGKYAVVTGASSGLGRQFALCLAEQGCNVAIAAPQSRAPGRSKERSRSLRRKMSGAAM